jgi:hypothetical protein
VTILPINIKHVLSAKLEGHPPVSAYYIDRPGPFPFSGQFMRPKSNDRTKTEKSVSESAERDGLCGRKRTI